MAPSGTGPARKRVLSSTAAAKAAPPAEPHAPPPLLKTVVDALEDHKALDIAILPLHGKASFTDYMVIASGTSTRHVASMAKGVAEKAPHTILGLEGLPAAEWVCADMGGIVVHLFVPEKRALYNLEKLWSFPF